VISGLFSDTPLLLLLFCIFLSAAYSRDVLMSAGAGLLFCLNLGLYLILAAVRKDIGTEKLYKLLNAACLIACIIGLYQFASGNLRTERSWVDENIYGSLTRIYSTLLNPNIFAAYLAMNLSFALARFKNAKEDMLLTLNIILASICLLLTYSRGGIIAFGTSMLVLCLLKERKKGLAMYTAVMAAAFFMLNSAGHNSRAYLTSIYQDSSSLYRVEIWKTALRMFLERPLFGNGMGTTWYYLSGESDKLYKYILHCHNVYLHVATEFGITGLFAFAYMFWSRISESCRLLKNEAAKEEAYVLQGFVACIAGIMAHGLIDAVVFVPAMSLVFMGYFALHRKVLVEYRAVMPHRIRLPYLLDGKGVLQLFWGKGAGKNKYKEKESEAC
jgi:O-antigen ligase